MSKKENSESLVEKYNNQDEDDNHNITLKQKRTIFHVLIIGLIVS